MLRMEIAKPTQFAMVSAEPNSARGAFCALSVENCGESPTTTTPQKRRKARNSGVGAWKNIGDTAQHSPDAQSCTNATRALPVFSEILPPAAQPTKPAAMMQNDQNGTLSSLGSVRAEWAASANGTNAQKA